MMLMGKMCAGDRANGNVHSVLHRSCFGCQGTAAIDGVKLLFAANAKEIYGEHFS
jgi:hypothetical protein